MSSRAILAEGLGKKYRIGRRRAGGRSVKEAADSIVKAPFRRLRHPGTAAHTTEDFWALRGASVEVAEGEVLGIIGRNGAGKSTLLKVLARITAPTEGRAVIKGRIGSLLEVGTGFHPELSGRENVFLNGSLLGMRKAEIARRFDEIVAFSEIEDFIDTPVKRYSSGMYVRLAFAVAAHLETEILLVDEVLAVGDYSFQKKCLGKMGDVSGSGRTILFVSHNMSAVRALCPRAILLHHGEIVTDGDCVSVVGEYLAAASGGAETIREWPRDAGPGNEYLRLRRLELHQNGLPVPGDVSSASSLEVVMTFDVEVPSAKLQVGLELATADGTQVFQSFHTDSGVQPPLPTGPNQVRCTIPAGLLNQGSYVLKPLAALYFEAWILHQTDDYAVRFGTVLEHPQSELWYAAREGALAPALQWQAERPSLSASFANEEERP